MLIVAAKSSEHQTTERLKYWLKVWNNVIDLVTLKHSARHEGNLLKIVEGWLCPFFDDFMMISMITESKSQAANNRQIVFSIWRVTQLPDCVQLGLSVDPSTNVDKPVLVHHEKRCQLLLDAVRVKDVKDHLLDLKGKA